MLVKSVQLSTAWQGMQSDIPKGGNAWQRSTTEHTNRLLRQYVPKGTELAIHSQATPSAIA